MALEKARYKVFVNFDGHKFLYLANPNSTIGHSISKIEKVYIECFPTNTPVKIKSLSIDGYILLKNYTIEAVLDPISHVKANHAKQEYNHKINQIENQVKEKPPTNELTSDSNKRRKPKLVFKKNSSEAQKKQKAEQEKKPISILDEPKKREILRSSSDSSDSDESIFNEDEKPSINKNNILRPPTHK